MTPDTAHTAIEVDAWRSLAVILAQVTAQKP